MVLAALSLASSSLPVRCSRRCARALRTPQRALQAVRTRWQPRAFRRGRPDKKDWGRPVAVDKTLDQASADDYDAVVLPGGQINPDLLRVEPKALKFIKD